MAETGTGRPVDTTESTTSEIREHCRTITCILRSIDLFRGFIKPSIVIQQVYNTS